MVYDLHGLSPEQVELVKGRGGRETNHGGVTENHCKSRITLCELCVTV